MTASRIYLTYFLKTIHYAVNSALAGDIVFITGKGRENYQLLGNKVIPYSDIQAMNSCLNIHKYLDLLERVYIEERAFSDRELEVCEKALLLIQTIIHEDMS